MTFERLGPIVERVVSRLVNDAGKGAIAVAPVAEERAGTDQGPGQVAIREVIPTQRADEGHAPASPANGRPIVTAQTKRRPTSAVAIGLVLVVDNGDRPGRREETAPGRSIAQARGGNLASNLMVVGGRDHCAALSITGVSIRSRNS